MRTEKRDWLLKTEIFASLDDAGLDLIAGYSEFVTYSEGGEIFNAGSVPASLHIVISGTVQIVKSEQFERDYVIAELAPGDIIGELEFFTGSAFTATGRASSDSVLLRVPGSGESFSDILEKNPGIAAAVLYEFLKVISGRIRNANTLVRENSALIQELKRQVYGDKLTGLYNKTYLEETLPGLMKRGSGPVGLLLMKPDNFKLINDTYGHEAGDDTLKIMAVALNKFMDGRGTVLRYMGNELGVILPGYGRDESRTESEKILKMLNELDISPATGTDDVALSMSIGISVYPEHANVSDELIALAHELPLEGRARGGNLILFPEDVKEG